MASGTQSEQEIISLQLQKGMVVGSSDGARNPVTLWANSSTHRLLVDIGSPTITASPASNGLTGAAVPTSADYIGVNSGGNLIGLAVGQATMANSIPVVIASNQSGLPVTNAALTNMIFDGSGFLKVNVAAGSSGNAAASATGSAVPSSADYNGLNVAGNLRGQTGVNPSGSVYAAQNDISSVGGSTVALGQTTMANSIPVVLASNQASIPVTGTFWQTTQPVSGTFWQTTQPVSISGNQAVNLAQVGASSVSLGQNTMANSIPVAIASNQGALPINLQTATSGGWSPSSQTALSNTKTQVKSSAGQIGGYMFYNPNSTVIYIQVFDVASGSITVGTTAPTYVIPIPPLSAANVEFTQGIAHATAINIAATTTPTGSTAPGTALTGFFLFK
jgi:hypothetical protein